MSLLTAGFSEFPRRWNNKIKIYPHDRLMAATLLRLLPHDLRPNHLTIFRLTLVLPILIAIGFQSYCLAMGLFVLAGLTDALDGSMARTRKQISDWGIIWDPLADKILIGSVIILVVVDLVNPYLGLALILVELAMVIGGWRRLKRGIIEPANVWGKTKMIFEVVGLTLLLLAAWLDIELLVTVSVDTLVLALLAALISVFARLR